MTPRDALKQALSDALPGSKPFSDESAEKILAAMEGYFIRHSPHTYYLGTDWGYGESQCVNTFCIPKEDEHVLYWKRRAKEYKPDGVNIGPAAWIEIARESGFNPKVCAALRSIELCADSYLNCLRTKDPEVSELIAALTAWYAAYEADENKCQCELSPPMQAAGARAHNAYFALKARYEL